MNQPRKILLKNLRKKLLINRPFQVSFIQHACAMAGITLLACFAANRFFIWDFRHRGERAGLPPTNLFFRFIDDQATAMNWILLAMAVIVFAILFVYGLYLSNRIAGPIYRIEKHLRSLSEGKDPGSLAFRKKDYFKELEEPVNALVNSVRRQK